jgi:hypothetical protein
MLRKTNGRKATPINSPVTAEISLPSGEIPLSLWNYKIPNFSYHKMCNWNGGGGDQVSLDM